MAQANYDTSIARVLKSEGGYSNNPSDPGGPTNFGVTISVYRENGHAGASAADVKAMKLDEAKRIYRRRYADPIEFDQLSPGLDYAVLDYAVNSGVSRANKVLRRVIGLADADPIYKVLGQLSTRDINAVISAYDNERLQFLHGLKTWRVFGKGWGPRVASVNAAALKMAAPGGTAAPSKLPPVAPPVGDASGKGEVPKPSTVGPVITGGGTAIGGAFSFGEWVAAHPVVSAAILGAVIITVIFVAELIARKVQAAKQDAPTPGLIPVPALN